jgi:hypothetical protein
MHVMSTSNSSNKFIIITTMVNPLRFYDKKEDIGGSEIVADTSSTAVVADSF